MLQPMVQFDAILYGTNFIANPISGTSIGLHYFSSIKHLNVSRKIRINRFSLFQILFNLIFFALSYYMSGLPNEYFRFGLFAIVGLMVSFVAEGMGLAIGATFSITVN